MPSDLIPTLVNEDDRPNSDPLWQYLSRNNTSELNDDTLHDTLILSIVHTPHSLNKSMSIDAEAHSPKTNHLSESLFGLKPAQASLNTHALDKGELLDFSQSVPADFSDFRLTEILGEGGMGRVYLGVQTCLNREVALKVSKVNTQDPRLIAQVFHEAQITATLDHPNILPVHLLALTEDQEPIQVMKRINGVTWSELLVDSKHPFWMHVDHPDGQEHFHLEVLSQVSQAMSCAHDHHIIHRDLKPENIMIGRFGEVFVLDWGVALYLPAIGLTASETHFSAQVSSQLDEALVGTPAYMPPEMARSAKNDLGTWTDVFLLGAILYEILCGERIRRGNDIKVLFHEINTGTLPPLPSYLSEEFRSLIEASLASDHEHRIENGQSFRKLLVHAMHTEQAAKVQRKARRISRELVLALQDSRITEESYLSQLYDEARLTFRTSLEMWSSCARARRGLDKLHSVWGEHLIDKGDLSGAKRAIERLELPDPKLSQALELALSKKERLDQEHAQLQEWHADEQISHSRKLRLLFAGVGLVVFGFGSLLLDYLERHQYVYIDAESEVTAAVSLTILVYITFIIIFVKRRNKPQETNAIFQRLISHLVLITLAVSLQRYVSWQVGLRFEDLLHIEMPLIALGCFGLSAISGKKDFIWGGLAYTFVAILSLISDPDKNTLYALAMICLWLGVLISWWREEN